MIIIICGQKYYRWVNSRQATIKENRLCIVSVSKHIHTFEIVTNGFYFRTKCGNFFLILCSQCWKNVQLCVVYRCLFTCRICKCRKPIFVIIAHTVFFRSRAPLILYFPAFRHFLEWFGTLFLNDSKNMKKFSGKFASFLQRIFRITSEKLREISITFLVLSWQCVLI